MKAREKRGKRRRKSEGRIARERRRIYEGETMRIRGVDEENTRKRGEKREVTAVAVVEVGGRSRK